MTISRIRLGTKLLISTWLRPSLNLETLKPSESSKQNIIVVILKYVVPQPNRGLQGILFLTFDASTILHCVGDPNILLFKEWLASMTGIVENRDYGIGYLQGTSK